MYISAKNKANIGGSYTYILRGLVKSWISLMTNLGTTFNNCIIHDHKVILNKLSNWFQVKFQDMRSSRKVAVRSMYKIIILDMMNPCYFSCYLT